MSVRVRPAGEGFEMSGFGAVPIGTPYLDPMKPLPAQLASLIVQPVDKGGRRVRRQESEASEALPATPARQSPGAAPASPLTPRGVLKAARERAKQIRAELKTKRALERELAELERLIRAAREKPTTSVRALKRVG